jgi:hypothetical protein
MKYTPEMLAEAARQSTTIADVLRYLGIRLTGGAHSHIRRRLIEFGIDTSHFTGQAHLRGRRSPKRLTPDQVLVIRPSHRKRAPGSLLTKAMLAKGVEYQCTECGIGPLWNGTRLNLHVDHVNGDFADCRLENLRFLCPNCHSQTSTFAGRGKRKGEGAPVKPQPKPISRTATTALTVRQAADLLGCSVSHFYKLRAKLALSDDDVARLEQARTERRLAVVACAMNHPQEGPRKIAERLRAQSAGTIDISSTTVSNILNAAGLNTAAARLRARDDSV